MRIALGHQSRVGKDTIADYLIASHSFTKVSFSEDLYRAMHSIQDIVGAKRTKDTGMLQGLGTLMRSVYGPDVFADLAMKKIDLLIEAGVNVVVSDLRFKNELKALRQRGFTTVRIVRTSRVIDRDTQHQSEVDLNDAQFDYTVVNDSSIGELFARVDEIIGVA